MDVGCELKLFCDGAMFCDMKLSAFCTLGSKLIVFVASCGLRPPIPSMGGTSVKPLLNPEGSEEREDATEGGLRTLLPSGLE